MHEINNILTELIFILLHLFLFLFNYYNANKNLFYPPVLFSILWTVILALHFIFGLTILDEMEPITISTFVVLFIGTFCFTLGAFIVRVSHHHNVVEKESSEQRQEISRLLRIIFMGIIAIGLPFYIQASFKVFLASQLDNFFVGLRTELSYGEEDIGPTKYLMSFSFVVFALNYLSLRKEPNNFNRVLVITSLLITVVYAIFATGRTYFLMILVIYLGITYILNKNFSYRKFAWAFAIFLPVFMFIGMIYGKGGEINDSFKNNLSAASETTAIYLVSAVNALDMESRFKVKSNYRGDNTLGFFLKLGQQLNIITNNNKKQTLLKEFVFTPYATNVYTFYSSYIGDFGKIYAWFMIGLFGALHTWIYYRAIKTKKLRYILYYSFLLYPLLMSFFQDQYMSLFSIWLQLIFYIEVFLVCNSFLVRKTRARVKQAGI